MAVLKWLLVLAVVGYAGLLALMYVFQRALMYFPDAKRVAPAQAGLPRAAEVTFASSDGENLLAWYVPPDAGKPLVIYFQGNAEGLAARVGRFTWLTADGTGLLALCYRGYGGSSGTPSEDGLIRDTAAAYGFARERIPARRIVLFGESLGTAVAVALAAGHDVAAVILDAPFTSAAEVGAAIRSRP
jgi:cephalosporin-C deacetylase-like acetyl esterase